MKKQAIAFAIFGILAISLASASIVPFLSNRVTGVVSVSGPIFYAAAENKLVMNEDSNSILLYDIENSNDEKFWSETFEESLDFYPMEIEMQVMARVTKGDLPKRMYLEFGFMRDDNRDNICRKEILVTSNDLKIYSTSCTRTSDLNNVDGFYYIIEGMGVENVTYGVQVGDSHTFVKINGIEN